MGISARIVTSLGNETLSVIHKRRSVRHFTGEKVSRQMVEQLLRAGMAAPTAMHGMPWRFIVVTERCILQELEESLPFARMLVQAGTAIVVCAAPGQAALGKEEFAILDCACASENILLAAQSLDLGAVWTAVYPNPELMLEVRKILGIPKSVIPLNVIPVGVPVSGETATDKFDTHHIHWEKW